MLPEPYVNTINDMRAHFHSIEANAAAHFNDQVNTTRRQHEQVEAKITNITNKFLQTGVFFLENQWDSIPRTEREPGAHYSIPLTVYCKQLAKSMNRPFVRVFGEGQLLIPKLKKLDVLTVPFMFAAEQVRDPYYLTSKEGLREVTKYETLYDYRFIGNEGAKFFAMWCEHIKAPECRKALGFAN